MSPEQNADAPQAPPPVATPPPGPQAELTLADYAAIIWRRRKLVLGCAAAGILAALAAHFLLPKKYEATALVLPPQSDDSAMGTAAKLAGLADSLPAGLLGIKSNVDRYVDMLGSELILDEIIAKFELAKRQEGAKQVDLRRRLQGSTVFKTTKGGLITIAVRDREPETAARMANGFAEALDQLESKLNVGKAGKERLFLDQRVTEAEKDLKTVQEACRDFQQKHRIITVDEGLKATAAVMGELEGRRIAKEIELKVLTAVYAQGSPQIEALKSEVKQLGEKLKEFSEKGVRGPGEDGTGQMWLFPRIDAVPALALEQMDLERRLRLNAELYRLLVTQREMARINEAKERSAVQVVAPATAPDRPAGMGGLAKLLLGTIVGAVVGVMLAGFMDRLGQRPLAADERK